MMKRKAKIVIQSPYPRSFGALSLIKTMLLWALLILGIAFTDIASYQKLA
jgi:hypothetical protein